MIKPQTITISNFGGRLTRIINGDLISGFAKFTTSFGYDPFSKPMNLTWLETPTSIAGISDVIFATANRLEALPIVYAVGNSGKAYRIQPMAVGNPNLDSVIGIGSVTSGDSTYNYGAAIQFFGTPEKMYVGGDKRINSVPISSILDGTFSGDAPVGTVGNYVQNTTRPLALFGPKLLFGNGPTFGAVGTTGTVTSSIIGMSVGSSGAVQDLYSEINPPLPPELSVKDLDIAPDFSYMYLTASESKAENLITITNDRDVGFSSSSNISKWNGTDAGITAGVSMPGAASNALQTYFQNNIIFSNDSFGTTIGTESRKELMLPNNKAPFRSATGVNGNYVYWGSTEVVGGSVLGSLYYFGSLDQENPSGLYRLMRLNTNLAAGYVYQIGCVSLVGNQYNTVNNALTSIASFGYGKHYISTFEINPSNTTPSGTTSKLYRFLLTSSGTGTPQLGVYETQTQLFSKRMDVKQIRVYTEPTKAGNGFKVDMIGSDGAVMTNGTFNYTFVAGSDDTKLQGSLERVNFNPTASSGYALGIRLTNTGTVNMTIKKVEIDYEEQGK